MLDEPEQPPLILLVVDPHRAFAEALAMRLDHADHVARAEVAFNLDVVPALVNTLRPDVLLLDHDLAGAGLQPLMAALGRQSDAPRVLIVAPDDFDVGEVVDALRTGVRGWVTREASYEELTAAIHAVAVGHLWLQAEALDRVIPFLLTTADGPLEPQGFLAQLSPRETEVLQCLAAAMTRAEVAEALFISPNTVRTHVQRLLRVSGQHSTPALVAAAGELGLPPLDTTARDSSVVRTRTHPL
jgi:DNA-binding NarL/FixJ family response regulator